MTATSPSTETPCTPAALLHVPEAGPNSLQRTNRSVFIGVRAIVRFLLWWSFSDPQGHSILSKDWRRHGIAPTIPIFGTLGALCVLWSTPNVALAAAVVLAASFVVLSVALAVLVLVVTAQKHRDWLKSIFFGVEDP